MQKENVCVEWEYVENPRVEWKCINDVCIILQTKVHKSESKGMWELFYFSDFIDWWICGLCEEEKGILFRREQQESNICWMSLFVVYKVQTMSVCLRYGQWTKEKLFCLGPTWLILFEDKNSKQVNIDEG